MSKIELVDYLKKSYMDYAASVIVGRAIPSVYDGLKPVQRRSVYALHDLGIYNNKPYKKSARIVGEVIGKYHPHGDSSVYDALVRMAQGFSLRYPLVDGHGNFGTIDGDSPAHMRYTEMRLSKITQELLKGLNKNTVDFTPNFDGEEIEPTLLPSRFPNLLVNGSSGIAVGYATNIPPHNLTDVINTILYQIDNKDCTIAELVDIIKAPDFPLGGNIINQKDMLNMYTNGKGSITIRSKYTIDKIDGRDVITITEIPYGINKARTLDKVIELSNSSIIKEKVGNRIKETEVPPVIPQIDTVKDRSSAKNGILIQITLKKNSNVKDVLKLIFKHTDLQCNFGANFTAVDGTTLYENLSLKEINDFYIKFQKDIITRRTQFDLEKATRDRHIAEGFIKALEDVDRVIEIIRSSNNKKDAQQRLIDAFGFSGLQSEKILELRLHRLTNMEIEFIKEELRLLNETINRLNNILSNESELLNVLKEELIELRDTYGDDRKTQLIEDDLGELNRVVEDYNCNITISNDGWIKKCLKASDSHKLKDGDFVIDSIKSNNRDTLYLITNKANRYKLSCDSLEKKLPSALGQYIPSLVQLEDDEKVIKVISVSKPVGYVICVYENGKIAKIDIKSYMSNNTKLVNCFNTDSKLIAIDYIEKECDVLFIAEDSKALIVDTSTINSKGSKSSQGNIGIKLNDGNKCIYSYINVPKDFKFTVETKTREIDFMLDDVSLKNDERTLYAYLKGRTGNKGNKLLQGSAVLNVINNK